MSVKIKAYIKITLAMVIVGSSVVAGKLLIETFPVFLASELRFLIATLILLPMLIKLEGIPVLAKKDLFTLFLQALSGVFLFSIFMLYGLKYTTAIAGGIITSTLPAVIALMAYFMLREKLSKMKAIGILLAIMGTGVIHIFGAFPTEKSMVTSLLGNLLIMGAVVGEALFIIWGKSISSRVSPLAISAIVSLYGSILFLPLAIYEAIDFDFTNVALKDWGIIVYFGVVVTVISFIFMYQGIQQVPASTAGVLTGVMPISTVLLSALLLKESVSWYHVVGMISVILAIYLMSIDSKRPQKFITS